MGGTSLGHVTFSPTAEQSSPSDGLSISSWIHTWPKSSLTPWSKQGWSVIIWMKQGCQRRDLVEVGVPGERVTVLTILSSPPYFFSLLSFLLPYPFLFSYFPPSNFHENEVNLEILLVADFVFGCQKRWVQCESQRGWAESKARRQCVVQHHCVSKFPPLKQALRLPGIEGDPLIWIWLSIALQETDS